MDRLERTGLAIRQHVHGLMTGDHAGLCEVVGEEGGDTIYEIDRRVEPIVEQCISTWPAECFPLMLIAEGMGHDGRRVFGPGHGSSARQSDEKPGQAHSAATESPVSVPGVVSQSRSSAAGYRVIVDPIDGTRGLMYDKRSAWFIAAVAPDRGDATSLGDAFASVLVELPVSKQGFCDTISAIAGRPARLIRQSLFDQSVTEMRPSPSRSHSTAGGFGYVVSFFQGTRLLAAELMERIAAETVPFHQTSATAVLDDQYISTGGQMVELIMGHDRFCCDLRPLLREIRHRESGILVPELVCHPYDAAGMLVAQQAGVIITDAFGRDLNAPLDVHTPTHWCGYANEQIRQVVAPVIVKWLAEHGITAPPPSP